MNQPHYYLFGDSLTQYGLQEGGWIHQIQNRFGNTALSFPRGRSGYNSTWILNDIETMSQPALDLPPCFISLLIGSNDCCRATHQFVEKPVFEYNIEKLVKEIARIHKISPERIYLITPPPNLDLDRQEISEYADIVRKVARSYKTQLVDLWTQQWHESAFTDGVHLSPEGNSILAKCLLKSLKEDVVKDLDKFTWTHWSER